MKYILFFIVFNASAALTGDFEGSLLQNSKKQNQKGYKDSIESEKLKDLSQQNSPAGYLARVLPGSSCIPGFHTGCHSPRNTFSLAICEEIWERVDNFRNGPLYMLVGEFLSEYCDLSEHWTVSLYSRAKRALVCCVNSKPEQK